MRSVAVSNEADAGNTSSHPFIKLHADLVNAHAEVQAGISDLAKICSQGRPIKIEYTGARFRISHASLKWRSVRQAIGTAIPAFLTATECKALSELLTEANELAEHSHRHVSVWTTEEVDRNWPGYQAASKAMRLQMLNIVSREKALLIPMLAGVAHRHS